MKGHRESGFSIAMMIIVVLIPCIWAGHYVQLLSEPTAILRVSAIASAVAAIAAIFALLILVKYTIETRLLRQISQGQFEGSIKPIVLVVIESGEYVPGQRRSIKTPQLRNIGMGPAFDVAVEPIIGKENVVLRIENVPLIESKSDVPASCSAVENSGPSGLARIDAFRDHMFDAGRFPDRTRLTVNFKGLSEKHYRVLQLIRYELNTGRVWTEFVRIESTED